MGARLVQRSRCLPSRALNQLVMALQERITRQLAWDPRIVDVYVQRVMMLAESGATHRIKPVWLRRVLEAELADGSWSGFHPLVPVGGGYLLALATDFPSEKTRVIFIPLHKEFS